MKQKIKSWTVLEILKSTTEYFAKKKVDNPRLNSERLLSYLLKIDRIQLYVQFERVLKSPEIQSYRDLVQRRASHEPLQYIIGETEFMGLPIRVTPDVLIPRPETELLIEKVLELKDRFGENPISILDIGTGSGCLAISLAHHWKECKVTATDISENSLQVAGENAKLNHVSEKIDFIKHDILTADSFPLSHADIIVSNPPYIGLQEMGQLDLEIRNFEPSIALTDNEDGTVFYERILALIDRGFQCKFVFMELNSSQTDKIIQIINKYGFTNTSVIPDLNNLPRVLKIEI